MSKWGRKYNLTWFPENKGTAIEIALPFTIQFDISRSSMASLNTGQIRVYNLNPNNRNRMFQDRFDVSLTTRKEIVFQAGYDSLSTIFKGDVFEAYSYRQGTDIITFLDCVDGVVDASQTTTTATIQEGTKIQDVLTKLVSGFTNVTQGSIGDLSGDIKRPVALEGNTFDLIKKYSDNTAFIDNGVIHILKDNETIEGNVVSISSETGLLGVPRRRGNLIDIETIFEPRVMIGQVIDISSKVQPQYDGQYKVVGINHSGMISAAVCGQCKSKFTLLIGSKSIGGLKNV